LDNIRPAHGVLVVDLDVLQQVHGLGESGIAALAGLQLEPQGSIGAAAARPAREAYGVVIGAGVL
jgi:hypothetical protein